MMILNLIGFQTVSDIGCSILAFFFPIDSMTKADEQLVAAVKKPCAAAQLKLRCSKYLSQKVVRSMATVSLLLNVYITMEHHHFLCGQININQLFLWPFSIANCLIPGSLEVGTENET